MYELNDLVLDNPRYQPGEAARKAAAAQAAEPPQHGLFGPEGFSFSDFLDIVNPLQHIPIVSTIYRAVTGDKIETGSSIAGDTLFGGPIGLVVSLVNAVVEETTGKGIGEQALAMVGIDLGSDATDQPATAVATAPQPSAEPEQVPPEVLAAMQPPPALKMNVGRSPAAAPAATTDRQTLRPDARAEKAADVPVGPESESAVYNQQIMTRELAEQQAASRRAVQQMMAAHQISEAQTNLPPQALTTGNPATPAAAAPRGNGDPAAIIAAMAKGPQPGARSVAAAPAAGPQVVDGRAWFPAFPKGGGVPVRAVGTQPVTQQAVTSKFGPAKAPPSAPPVPAKAAASGDAGSAPVGDWADRAAAAYQKYYDMQQQTDRTRAVDMQQ